MELLHCLIPDHSCSYVPSETARTEVKVLLNASELEYEALLCRGWRRFGTQFFRPVCEGCVKCQSLRIPVRQFQANRSQRRCLEKNRDIELAVGLPTVTSEHLDLFGRYHNAMEVWRGWPISISSVEDYAQTFVAGYESFGKEITFRLNGRLVGVALTDLLPNSLSSVYFYHDPEYRSRGLGIFSILSQIEIAANLGLEHQYLGFWIEENVSMKYKSQFKPYEILKGRPYLSEAAIWESLS